jgi:hypothetical protein
MGPQGLFLGKLFSCLPKALLTAVDKKKEFGSRVSTFNSSVCFTGVSSTRGWSLRNILKISRQREKYRKLCQTIRSNTTRQPYSLLCRLGFVAFSRVFLHLSFWAGLFILASRGAQLLGLGVLVLLVYSWVQAMWCKQAGVLCFSSILPLIVGESFPKHCCR